VQKPFLHPLDPLTFAELKAQAKAVRGTRLGAGLNSQAPAPMKVATPKAAEWSQQTVNPPESTFPGISSTSCGAVNGGFAFPFADIALAVGDTSVGVMQAVNDCLSVFDKNGLQQAGYPKSSPTFFGVDPVANPNVSEPRMIFDWINHRYIFVAVSYPNSCATQCASPAFYNVAVSMTDNPTGSWCLAQFGVLTGPNPNPSGVYALLDFPRLGQDRQAIYIASTLYQPSYAGEEVVALAKSSLYSCSSLSAAFVGRLSGFAIQPANQYSPNDDPKSMYFVTSDVGGTGFRIWVSSWHDPFGQFTTPSFTQVIVNPSTGYTMPPDASQCGTSTRIATGDDRFGGTAMYAAGSIYAALTSGTPAGLMGNGQPWIINYKIEPFLDTSGTATDGQIIGARILNEILRGASTGSNAWYYPAMQPDAEGNVTEVFGFSSSTTCPSVGYLSRRAAQKPDTEPDNGVLAAVGPGPYISANPHLSGDYFATAPAGIVSGGGTGGFPKMWFSGRVSTSTPNLWSTVIGRTGYDQINQNIPTQTGSK